MKMELQARCREVTDLQIRKTLNEESRKSYTLLGMSRGYDSRKRRLYLDAVPLGLIPPDTKTLVSSRKHSLRVYADRVKLEDSRVHNSPEHGYWFNLHSDIEDNREAVELFSNQRRPLRVDIRSEEELYNHQDCVEGVRTFFERSSKVPRLIVDESLSVTNFRGSNLNDTFRQNEIADVVKRVSMIAGLNASQCHALQVTLQHHTTCIQRSSGTGETIVAEAIAEALQLLHEKNAQGPFLTIPTAPSNVAVNSMETGVANDGGRILRNGTIARRRATLEAMSIASATDYWLREQVLLTGTLESCDITILAAFLPLVWRLQKLIQKQVHNIEMQSRGHSFIHVFKRDCCQVQGPAWRPSPNRRSQVDISIIL